MRLGGVDAIKGTSFKKSSRDYYTIALPHCDMCPGCGEVRVTTHNKAGASGWD